MADQMTTPDPTLAARLAELAAKDPVGRYIDELVNTHRSGQLITLADHTAAVAKAVEAEREAAKSLVWTLGHEIRSAMLVDEDNEQTVLDMVKATAAAIRSRGVAG